MFSCFQQFEFGELLTRIIIWVVIMIVHYIGKFLIMIKIYTQNILVIRFVTYNSKFNWISFETNS